MSNVFLYSILLEFCHCNDCVLVRLACVHVFYNQVIVTIMKTYPVIGSILPQYFMLYMYVVFVMYLSLIYLMYTFKLNSILMYTWISALFLS